MIDDTFSPHNTWITLMGDENLFYRKKKHVKHYIIHTKRNLSIKLYSNFDGDVLNNNNNNNNKMFTWTDRAWRRICRLANSMTTILWEVYDSHRVTVSHMAFHRSLFLPFDLLLWVKQPSHGSPWRWKPDPHATSSAIHWRI